MNAWRDIFYRHQSPLGGPLLGVAAVSVALLAISAWVFERRREEFAELI
jgi:ABC-type polysaccharide/polyol phosphate export permease